jgi:large conductance mechanosensitive channel
MDFFSNINLQISSFVLLLFFGKNKKWRVNMKKFFEEFKDFALRGNVMDLAVAVIIGGAFQAIVSSLTEDIISPIIGIAGSMDFSSYVLSINGSEIRYGAFITSIVNFLIMALIIFLMIKGLNKLTSVNKKPEAPAEVTTKVCPYCLSEIPKAATKCCHCTSDLPAGQ